MLGTILVEVGLGNVVRAPGACLITLLELDMRFKAVRVSSSMGSLHHVS